MKVVKAKDEWTKEITLKNTAINSDKRISKTIRKNRRMAVRIKIINELLHLIWDVMIFQNSRNEIHPGYDIKLQPVVEFRRGIMRLPFATITSRSPLGKA